MAGSGEQAHVRGRSGFFIFVAFSLVSLGYSLVWEVNGMETEQWKRTIRKQMREAQTYQKHFEPVISTLATILDARDAVYDQFLEEGAEFLVERKSDRGARNLGKNPLLIVWAELNTSALAYWRDLGLTPAGLKRLDEKALKPKRMNNLEKALKALG